MMNRGLLRATIALLVLMLMMGTMISALASVPATPNQGLHFRTGPNTKYADFDTLPRSTYIEAIEYEKGNGVTWVLVEFYYAGQPCRAYTGLKRMTVHGYIPWASHYNQRTYMDYGGTVLAAPYDWAYYRGSVYSGQWVTLLDFEDGYAYIEYSNGGAPTRGYVEAWMIH